jgi:hypothetical protein
MPLFRRKPDLHLGELEVQINVLSLNPSINAEQTGLLNNARADVEKARSLREAGSPLASRLHGNDANWDREPPVGGPKRFMNVQTSPGGAFEDADPQVNETVDLLAY